MSGTSFPKNFIAKYKATTPSGSIISGDTPKPQGKVQNTIAITPVVKE